MLIRHLVGVVVLLNDGGEQGGKQGVALFISRVDTVGGIQVHHTGLDAIPQGGTTGGLLVLHFCEGFKGEVFLQRGLDLWFEKVSWVSFRNLCKGGGGGGRGITERANVIQ